MKLFRIWQEVNNGYDTYDSAIVAAESDEQARITSVCEYMRLEFDESEDSWMRTMDDGSKRKDDNWSWAHPKHVQVEYIGEAKEGTEKGVILASFNAG